MKELEAYWALITALWQFVKRNWREKPRQPEDWATAAKDMQHVMTPYAGTPLEGYAAKLAAATLEALEDADKRHAIPTPPGGGW